MSVLVLAVLVVIWPVVNDVPPDTVDVVPRVARAIDDEVVAGTIVFFPPKK